MVFDTSSIVSITASATPDSTATTTRTTSTTATTTKAIGLVAAKIANKAHSPVVSTNIIGLLFAYINILDDLILPFSPNNPSALINLPTSGL